MKRFQGLAAGLALGIALSALLLLAWRARTPEVPPTPIYIDTVRDALKLETLEVELHQRIAFEPDVKAGDTLASQLTAWAKDQLAHEQGEAIVFGVARYHFNLARLTEKDLRVEEGVVKVNLPEVLVTVELKPDEMLLVRSSLAPGGEAQLLAKGKRQLEAAAEKNVALVERARRNAENALSAMFSRAGYSKVQVTPLELPPTR